MRDSELAHLDNHPADLASELHDEELDETDRDLPRRGGAPHRRGAARARRRHATAPAWPAAARSRRSGSRRCPRRCAASTASAASRAATASRRGSVVAGDRSSSPARPASSAPTSRACALERGDEVRAGGRGRLARRARSRTSTASACSCDVRDRRAVRRALQGRERVFHCAGVTSVRPADAERLFDVNVGGTKLVMEECLRAEVERVVYTSSAAAVGPGRAGQDRRRDAALHRRAGSASRTSTRCTRPRSRRCASRRAGCRSCA